MDKFYFVKKKPETTLILPKWTLKLKSSICSNFLLTIYLLCLADLLCYSYLLCSTSHRLVPLRGILNVEHAQSQARSKETWCFNFMFRYKYDVISLTNSTLGDYNHVLFSFVINHRIFNKTNTTGATIGTRASYPSGATVFCILLTIEFVFVFFFWSFTCLSFLELRHLNTEWQFDPMKTYRPRMHVDSLVYNVKRIWRLVVE